MYKTNHFIQRSVWIPSTPYITPDEGQGDGLRIACWYKDKKEAGFIPASPSGTDGCLAGCHKVRFDLC